VIYIPKRSLAIIGDRKKDKMMSRNSDSLEKMNPLLRSRIVVETDQETQLFRKTIFCIECRNHIPVDYWNDHGSRTLYQKATIQKLKDVDTIHFLRNSHETISLSETANEPHNLAHQSKDDNLLTIIGLDDPVTHKDDLAAAIDNIPEETPKILLTHNQSFTINPGISERSKSIDLILSGHPHGGQVFIFKYLPSFVIRWYFKRKSDDKNHGPAKTSGNSVPSVFQGLHRQGNTIGYVNRGLGTSYLPIRLGVRPEITLLEFVAP